MKSDNGVSAVVLLFRLRDVDHRTAFTLQNNIEAETVVIEFGLQLEIERRVLKAAGFVRVLPELVVFLAHGPEEP